MSKKQVAPITKFIYVVRVPGGYVGSPTDTVVAKPEQAGTWEQESEAQIVAQALGGTVATHPIVDHAATERAKLRVAENAKSMMSASQPSHESAPGDAQSAPARKPRGSKATAAGTAGVTPAASATKPLRGMARETLLEMLDRTGLQRTEKGGVHFGDPKGCRVVVLGAKRVTRLYAYKLELPGSPGFKSAEERKAERLGKVTNVLELTPDSAADVRLLIVAVCRLNGIELKADGTPKAKRGGKPAQSTLPTTGEN